MVEILALPDFAPESCCKLSIDGIVDLIVSKLHKVNKLLIRTLFDVTRDNTVRFKTTGARPELAPYGNEDAVLPRLYVAPTSQSYSP